MPTHLAMTPCVSLDQVNSVYSRRSYQQSEQPYSMHLKLFPPGEKVFICTHSRPTIPALNNSLHPLVKQIIILLHKSSTSLALLFVTSFHIPHLYLNLFSCSHRGITNVSHSESLPCNHWFHSLLHLHNLWLLESKLVNTTSFEPPPFT